MMPYQNLPHPLGGFPWVAYLQKYIMRYQKGSDKPRFATLEEHTKEAPWGNTCKIQVFGQDDILEAREDLLTLTKSPSQIPTNC